MALLPIFLIILAFYNSSSRGDFFQKFASSVHYRNSKLMFETTSSVLASQFYLVTDSELWTRLTCARECFSNNHCHAFNFYSNTSHHTCQLLTYNLCSNTTERMTLQFQPESLVYDRLNATINQSCVDQIFGTVPVDQWCETAYSGCNGSWPNCKCAETCVGSIAPVNTTSFPYTLRPGGNLTEPIFTFCGNSATHIMRRGVVITKEGSANYMMSLQDINRLMGLKVYSLLRFNFQTATGTPYTGAYRYPYIDINGTLSNLTFWKSTPIDKVDSLELNGGKLASAPFIWVVGNDSESCGSFWLLKPNNSMNCPGGGIGLFGAVQRNASGYAINSGIHWPGANGQLLKSGIVCLDI